MGLDVGNDRFGNFHLNWAGTRWFSNWCYEQGLPNPFIGWVSGDNSGDQCVLGPDNVHTGLARVWCHALEQKHPELAKLLSADEWERRAVAAWYAILKHGVEHGDTLGYY